MASMVDQIVNLISKAPLQRLDHEIEAVIPWLRKRSPLLQNQDKGILVDVVRYCAYQRSKKDEIVIKQADRGDCFYIILRGTVSVYIDPRMSGEDDGAFSPMKTPGPSAPSATSRATERTAPPTDTPAPLRDTASTVPAQTPSVLIPDTPVQEAAPKPTVAVKKTLDRSKFGKFIIKFEQGKAFGEVALVNKDNIRNSTVITDEVCDFLVVGQDLFDCTLRDYQEQEVEHVSNFIEHHPFFCHMTTRMKQLLEMSIRHEMYSFDSPLIKQGRAVTGLYFIIKGQAKVILEPGKHRAQYQQLWPFEAGIDLLSVEFEHLREKRRIAILRKYEDPAVIPTKSDDVLTRRYEGYAAVEKKMHEKHISLCSVQDGEVLGDTEMLLGLDSYMQTVKCITNTEVFFLDTKNFERLVGRRNTQTIDVMRKHVLSKLKTRIQMKNSKLIPLLQYLHHKLTEQALPIDKKLGPLKSSKWLPDKETQNLQLIQSFKENKAPLIDPIVPGALYYKELMREKAREREQTRRAQNRNADGIRLSVYRQKPKRQARSIVEIRESLQQMMQAEIISVESTATRKKLSRRSSNDSTLLSSYMSSNRLTDRSSIELPSIAQVAQSKQDEETVSSAALNIETSEKPVQSSVDTSASKPETASSNVTTTALGDRTYIKLPAIQEEKTNEDIQLKEQPKDPSVNEGDRVSAIVVKQRPLRTSAANENEKQLPQTKDLTPRSENGQEQDNSSQVSTMVVKERPLRTSNTGENIPPPATAAVFVTEGPNDSVSWADVDAAQERMQSRLTAAMLQERYMEVPEIDNPERSDQTLSVLENRINSFHIKYGIKPKMLGTIPKLRRYQMAHVSDVSPPKPGGKVWIKKRMCKFADSKIRVKDHEHVRHHIVPSLPELEEMRTRMMMQYLHGILAGGQSDVL